MDKLATFTAENSALIKVFSVFGSLLPKTRAYTPDSLITVNPLLGMFASTKFTGNTSFGRLFSKVVKSDL